MSLPRSSTTLLILAVTASACGGGWRRVEDLSPRVLPTRAQVQVWQGERATLLHAVTLEPDTLRGVPFTQPPACDSCGVRVPLAAVDSLRVGSRERGFFRTAGLVVAVGALWAYLVRDIGGS